MPPSFSTYKVGDYWALIVAERAILGIGKPGLRSTDSYRESRSRGSST